MRLSSKTLEATAEIITGNSQLSPYQKLWQITTFFRNFGERDSHPNSGAPSRFSYAFEKLEKFNDTDTIAKIICASLQFWKALPALDPEKAAAHLNKYLAQEGYRLELEFASSRMNGDKLEEYNPYFELRSLRTSVIETATLVRLSYDSINEHVAKARRKVEGIDLAGAIASAYTLVDAKLAVNAAFTLCEFLLESYEYQQALAAKKKTS